MLDQKKTTDPRPNVLYIMTDQQRFDTIAALGNELIHTPNLDRLVKRGFSFNQAYSTCPVCTPARYSIRTGCEPAKTGYYANRPYSESLIGTVEARCGDYLPRRMKQLGYRTFGIGKFHTNPRYEDLGYEVHLYGEEMHGTRPERANEVGYPSWLVENYPEFDFIEQLNGERTDMYYVPQTSALPASLNIEHWAATKAVEQIEAIDERPYFGFISMVGPHPPFAPPIPFNRIYDPDTMPNPIKGDLTTDHMDEQIPYMNHTIWADDISDGAARNLKARYYADNTFIDYCIGKILDAVESSEQNENTLICFFSDHGDHMGDHHAWQKESFFEASTKIPFLLSWPSRLTKNSRTKDFATLTDLFAIATRAAGKLETRDGHDILGALLDEHTAPRETIFGVHGNPGTPRLQDHGPLPELEVHPFCKRRLRTALRHRS